jgi:polar amino acid transport system substrate-binding protein
MPKQPESGNVNQPVVPQPLPPAVIAALEKGKLIEAIKLLRASNIGLKDAKDLIENYTRGAPQSAAAQSAASFPAIAIGGPLPGTVVEALQQGNKIEAIKRLRQLTGVGLKEAKDAVDAYQHTHTASGLSPGQVSDSGGGLWWIIAIVIAGLAAIFLVGCATQPAAPVAELAPTGKLRAAINFGNPILATKDAATGEPRGVSVDLARELGRRLGIPVELVQFTAAGRVVEAVKASQVDIAFVAIDPVRGADMLQTPPYVIIEGAYLVRNDSPIRRNEEVDRPGNRIVVGNASAYDLYLTRELKNAKLVKAPTSPTVVDTFLAQNAEVAAGVKQQLQADAKRLPGLRLLDGRFMVIQQAMGLPKGRDTGAAYVTRFIEEMKASGFVAEALKRHGIEGAAVAPPAH